jgi:hypothetical protein
MAGILHSVAEAVKTELNAATFGLEFHAHRIQHRRQMKLTELTTRPTVEVLPVMMTTELADRGSALHDCTVDIFIRQKMAAHPDQQQYDGTIDTDLLDELTELAEDIAVHFQPEQGTSRDGRLDTYEDAAWKSGRLLSGYVTDAFPQTRVFMAQVRLVFTV